MTLTRNEIGALWARGFRTWEIYVCNDSPVEYYGKKCAPGEITGWEIDMVVAKREELPAYPFFDAVIAKTDFSSAEYLWANGEIIDLKGDSK